MNLMVEATIGVKSHGMRTVYFKVFSGIYRQITSPSEVFQEKMQVLSQEMLAKTEISW